MQARPTRGLGVKPHLTMIILALDTSSRAGSVALTRDGAVVATVSGDPARTHGERLPGDILRLLADEGLSLAQVDLYAVSSGPGSFTSIRVGVATIQALALAHRRPVVPVSTLDAVARTLRTAAAATDLRAAWIDGQRGEVFAALYGSGAHGEEAVAPPSAGTAVDVLDTWAPRLIGRSICVGGDAVAGTRDLLEARLGPRATLLSDRAPLAPVIARIAAERAARGETVTPHAIKPVYVRRSDAELARDRRRHRGLET